MKKYLILISVILFLTSFRISNQDKKEVEPRRIYSVPPFLTTSHAWADSVIARLSPEERIAQLFMVAAYTEGDSYNQSQVNDLIQRYNIGGLIYFKGKPYATAQAINTNQSLARTPLMIGIDGEWGLSMRLDSTTLFPHAMTLGAVQNDMTVYNMGKEIARQCKLMGIHINFAPDVDVNNNPNNPVINDRAFSDNKYKVAKMGLAYMKGMQDAGILACAKHFPGHGDTDVDSHTGLPIVQHTRERLDSLEFFPFRTLIMGGVSSVMVAHMSLPQIDPTPELPSTLSNKIVTQILKQDMGFSGLVFTDAMNMKALSAKFPPGIADVKALLAGNDVLLFSENVPTAITMIKEAIAKGEITQEEIDARVYKILLAKSWVGLNRYKPSQTFGLNTYLNSPESKVIRKKCYQEAITLVKDSAHLLPIADLQNEKIATLAIGSTTINDFQKQVALYTPCTHFNYSKDISAAQISSIQNLLDPYTTILLSVHDMKRKAKDNWGLTDNTIQLVNQLSASGKKVIVIINGNPYSLRYFDRVPTLMITYEDNELTQNLAAQAIFGAFPIEGRLPVTASSMLQYGTGTPTHPEKNFRLGYGLPEEVGINGTLMDSKINEIVYNAIASRAFPGCQVLVAKDGEIVYNKAFGHYTYENQTPVTTQSIYDIASMTKVCATTLQVMKAYEEKRVSLFEPIRTYLPDFYYTNKSSLTLHELLTHTAGLKSWIPFYRNGILPDKSIDGSIFSYGRRDGYDVQVADNFFMNTSYLDSMWLQIQTSEIKPRGNYEYSDLSLLITQRIIEKSYQKKLDELLEQDFYSCLGTTTLGYKPLQRFPKEAIVPTENDTDWRHQLLQGYVHDPAAAMMGGVAGHAGIFSNANDVAVIMQLLLNGGTYGGKRYLNAETIAQFTTQQCSCRRGYGFDKPETNPAKSSPTCECVSPLTYGHTGFTGTCVWTDPVYNLTYVFLSNRIHPSQENKKITSMNIRTDIQQAIYDCLIR